MCNGDGSWVCFWEIEPLWAWLLCLSNCNYLMYDLYINTREIYIITKFIPYERLYVYSPISNNA